MSILYINSIESDYLQDLTYAGLCEILGKENILDFPYHRQYHSGKRFFFSKREEYPRNLGLSKGDGQGKRSLAEVRKSLERNEYKIVVLASAKEDALNVFYQLLDGLRAPWVFIDGGDRPEIGGDFLRVGGEKCFNIFHEVCRIKKPGAIFKRELYSGEKGGNIFPLQFSVNTSIVPILDPSAEKSFNVVFWAVESSSVRREAFRILNGKYDCRANGSVPGQKFKGYGFRGGGYFGALNRSRIALSFRGEGFDTLRYWEIPACGSLLVSENPEICIPDNFQNKTHAVFCKNDLSDLIEILDYYISNEKEALEIARRGQEHLLKHHTHIKRAEYFLDVLDKSLKIRLIKK